MAPISAMIFCILYAIIAALAVWFCADQKVDKGWFYVLALMYLTQVIWSIVAIFTMAGYTKYLWYVLITNAIGAILNLIPERDMGAVIITSGVCVYTIILLNL